MPIRDLVARVRQQRLFQPGETVVVAVSGGADSVALLDILVQLQDERLNLVVAHLNHSLRGAESDDDQEFVSRLSAGYGLAFVCKRADVAGLAKESRLSLEDAGRRARYAFFEETAKAHGASSIALAHHQDDQAETVLIRLLRGAGGSGLSAMGSGCGSTLKRPLLQVSRSEIERYLDAKGLTYRTDATNADTAILRNSIRHELIPFLRRYNPKVSERLSATASILSADEELLDHLTETAFTRCRIIGDCSPPVGASLGAIPTDGSALEDAPSEIAFHVDAVSAEPRGLRFRLYRRALLELRGDLQRIGLSHLEAIDRLLTSARPNAKLKLPGACFAARSYGKLSFRTKDVPTDGTWSLRVTAEGRYALPAGGQLLVKRVPRPATLVPETRSIAYLDPERTPFPWHLRCFSPGDRFRPLGMSGRQKVKDIFMNEKIPREMRHRIPLLEIGGEIVWIAGVRMGEEARVTGVCETVVRVEILDITP